VNKTYRLNRSGRRNALLLTLAAAIVWLFAIIKLPDVLSSDTVRVSYRALPGTISALLAEGLSVNQIVPALLLVVLIVATPLLIWNLIEEWTTRYVVRDDGLEYDTVRGIRLWYPWSAITGLRRADPEGDAPHYEVLVEPQPQHQIRSRVLHWLHAQAFGRTRIPIYAQTEDRDGLLEEIVRRAGLAVPVPPPPTIGAKERRA
jgi:hypothetical protein